MKVHQTIKRKAILIGAQGGDNGTIRLKGVKQDLHNFKDYLLSSNGGAWRDEEITVLNNPTKALLLTAINNTHADYNFIYFSGHGFTSSLDKRMLVLKDGNIEDIRLFNYCQKQLIVIDACRNYVPSGIAGFPSFEDDKFSYLKQNIRASFDRAITNSPDGKMIFHSAQKGKSSYDTDFGGKFTECLLSVARNVKTQKPLLFRVEHLLGSVRNQIGKGLYRQIPTLSYKEGNLCVPFAVGIAQEVNSSNREKRVLSNANLGKGLLFTSMLALIAWGISQDD